MKKNVRWGAVATAAVALAASAAPGVAGAQATEDPRLVGRWSAPFEEAGARCGPDADGRILCNPAGSSVINLVTGRVLYWDALEATENVNFNIVAEAGRTGDSRSRILDLGGSSPSFRQPDPSDGGGDAAGAGGRYIFPEQMVDDPGRNDADLFCSDQVQLPDGRILVAGGTDWYTEPSLYEQGNSAFGIAELEGTVSARVFDPFTETWTQAGSMHHGRWYPSLVTMPSGDVFVAGGVTKLLKPLYDDAPQDSGRNVPQTEVFDLETGQWSENPPSANKSLPLYPRLHLLPNGHVYYDAAGQVFNPMGQAYDEAFWNIASSYDPATQRWNDLGVPGLPGFGSPGDPALADAFTGTPLDEVPFGGFPGQAGGQQPQLTGGFRGSAFSLMLPLEPDQDGHYSHIEFLTAGGVLGVTPGTYLATDSSRINWIDLDPATGAESFHSRAVAPLNQPRWYGTGVLAPTGEALIFSGASADEVVGPGTAFPVTTPELWNPDTEQWTPLADQGRQRTYHNTAMLLPDGRILVGGHAPISMGYAYNSTLPGGFSPNEGRDPSFEIYEPPYLHRGPRPSIVSAPDVIGTGSTFKVTVGSAGEAQEIADDGSVVLVRNTAMTHLVDSDQRSVELRVLGRDGATLTVAAPPDRAVTPAGPYMLFVNSVEADGLVPSVSAQVFVDTPVPAGMAAARHGADAGQPSQPIPTRDPFTAFIQNLMRFIGA